MRQEPVQRLRRRCLKCFVTFKGSQCIKEVNKSWEAWVWISGSLVNPVNTLPEGGWEPLEEPQSNRRHGNSLALGCRGRNEGWDGSSQLQLNSTFLEEGISPVFICIFLHWITKLIVETQKDFLYVWTPEKIFEEHTFCSTEGKKRLNDLLKIHTHSTG